MKVQLKVGAKAVVEAEGESIKQVFERVAALAGVFACADKCGACGGSDIIPQVREPQGYTYFELQCLGCGARLQFGQNKEGGGLFPKRDKGKNGWDVYQRQAPAHGDAFEGRGF